MEPDPFERRRLEGELDAGEQVTFDVESAETALAGSALLDAGLPDAVLLGADGPDVKEQLRTLRSIESGVPTIVVSAADLTHDAPAILAEGVDDVILRRSATSDVLRRVLSYAVERKRARRALRESKDLYRSFFEADLTGNFLCSPGGEIEACNQTFSRIFGLPVDARGPRPPMTAILGPKVWARMVNSLVVGGDRFSTELEVQSGGRVVFASTSLSGQFDAGGSLLQVQGAIRDITEQRNLETQLRQAQKMDALGRLAGGLAHDLNNLLTVIVGNNEMAFGEVDQKVKGYLGEIKRAANRGASMVDKLLAFSRQQPIEEVTLDLNTILSEMTSLARPLVGEQIDVDVSLDPRLRSVTIDKAQLEQVILNLLVNARDAMPDGGTIQVETRNGEVDDGEVVILRVTDNGCGMDEATRARIFEPFFTTKGVGEGTGLGLAVVYGIVEQYGGRIEVRSSPGEGSTFELTLPAADSQGEETGERDAPVAVEDARGDETVLLVEDELGLRTLLESALTARGFRVMSAWDAHQALRLLRMHGDVDVLLTDVVMPRMSGPELASIVVRSAPATRVIFMSGYPDPKLEGNPMSLREHVLVRKPFSPNEIALVIRQTLDQPVPVERAN